MRAVHLRTGDRSTDTAIASWLEQSSVEVTKCTDAFHACERLVRKPELQPDLAFIGLDWLPGEETRIIEYIRDVWPNVVTVIYGTTTAATTLIESPRTVLVRSVNQMRRMLADAPESLLETAQQAARAHVSTPREEWRPRSASEMDGLDADNITPNPPRVTSVEDEVETESPDESESPASENPGPSDEEAPSEDFPDNPGPPPPRPDELLSDEELTALLDDEDH